uniref:Secreted protein n=1 Tax=Steinernema glaseri TaxID=37863 RepID=A0A1I7YYH2_9BILA
MNRHPVLFRSCRYAFAFGEAKNCAQRMEHNTLIALNGAAWHILLRFHLFVQFVACVAYAAQRYTVVPARVSPVSGHQQYKMTSAKSTYSSKRLVLNKDSSGSHLQRFFTTTAESPVLFSVTQIGETKGSKPAKC